MRRLPALAAVLALALAAAGCVNPFMPATPPPPGAGATVPHLFGTEDQLLGTIEAAFESPGALGRAAYEDALADSTTAETFAFYAFFPPAIVDAYHAATGAYPPDPWDQPHEMIAYDYLTNYIVAKYPTLKYSFAWTKDNTYSTEDVHEPTSAILHRRYVYSAHSEDLVTVYKELAMGYADLYLQKVNGRWYLYRWEDRIDPQSPYGPDPVDPENVCMGKRRLDSLTGAS